jgi:MraZ protein
VFLGQYQHSIDEKGRVVVPKEFREELKPQCYATKGQEKCLYVFAQDQWEEECRRVSSLPRTDPRARRFSRSFFASASTRELDRQGRLQLSKTLIEYAGLESDAIVVGVADRIEIWSPDAWEEIETAADEYYAGIEEVLSQTEGI